MIAHFLMIYGLALVGTYLIARMMFPVFDYIEYRYVSYKQNKNMLKLQKEYADTFIVTSERIKQGDR